MTTQVVNVTVDEEVTPISVAVQIPGIQGIPGTLSVEAFEASEAAIAAAAAAAAAQDVAETAAAVSGAYAGDAAQLADAAEASATAAEIQAGEAAVSAADAQASQAAALLSSESAALSEAAAQGYEASALSEATAAAASAASALASQNAAALSETAAATSAQESAASALTSEQYALAAASAYDDAGASAIAAAASAQEAADSAQASEDSNIASATARDQAITAATDAGYAQTGAEAARDAAAASQQAAADSATQADYSATEAAGHAEAAGIAQGLAEGARDAAIASEAAALVAQQASEYAQGLSEDAATAAIAAQGLSENARDASVVAQQAAEYAQGIAETEAANAAASASAASGSASAALASEDAAEAAQVAAEYAQTEAEASATAAATSAGESAGFATAADQSAQYANQSKNDAEIAAVISGAYAGDAAQQRQDAETAAQNAAISQSAAEYAADLAGTSAGTAVAQVALATAEAEAADTSASAAAQSKIDADYSAGLAATSALNAETSATNSENSRILSAASADASAYSAQIASDKANEAGGYALEASGHRDAAEAQVALAITQAYNANLSAVAAAESSTEALEYRDSAAVSAQSALDAQYGATTQAQASAQSASESAASAVTAQGAAAAAEASAYAAQLSADDANVAAEAIRNFVDSVPKESVYAATTANITLSGNQTIDTVVVPAGSRVLVKNQTTASQNGIYVTASGAWTRATDFDESAEVIPGISVFVLNGSANIETKWMLITPLPITVGTTELSWTQVGSSGAILAGNNLVRVANTISLQALPSAQILIGDGSSLATARSISGAISLTNTGVTAINTGVITNAMIANAAGIVDSKLATISTAGKVLNSATTATSANTASAIVARDGSGNFSAGIITAALSGNATTATTLQTARTIAISGDLTGSASFNGSANISIASTLANSGVTAGTYTSVTVDAKGRVTAGTNPLVNYAPLNSPALIGTPTAPTAGTLINNTQIATTAYVVNRIANDAPTKLGVGASGTWGISVTGNANAANRFITPRTFWGQSFDGTGNVTGHLTGVGNITGSGNVVIASGGAQSNVTINTAGPGSIILDTGTAGGQIQLKGGVNGTRIFNGANTFFTYFNAEGLTANRALTLANGNTTLVAGTMVPTTGAGASGSWGISITGSSASCTGNAVTATTASNITRQGIATTTNAEHRVLLGAANNTAGASAAYVVTNASRLYYNPSLDRLTCGTFNGALSGNATTASTASLANSITRNATTTASGTPYRVMLGQPNDVAGPCVAYVVTNQPRLYYYPNTDTLVCGNLNGTATRANSAAAVDNGVYTSGDQVINGIKQFNSDLRVATNATRPGGGSGNVAGVVLDTVGGIWCSRNNAPALSVNNFVNGTCVNLRRGASIVGSIDVTASGTTYRTTSDYRLKENIIDLAGGIAKLLRIRPRTFNFKVEPNETINGFIAHELQEVVPDAVSGTKDAVADYGDIIDSNTGEVIDTHVAEPSVAVPGQHWEKRGTEPVYQGVDNSRVVPLLTAALQETIALVQSLEARIAALEG